MVWLPVKNVKIFSRQCNNHIRECHYYTSIIMSSKPRKKTIPKALRDAVWVTYVGEKYKGNCYVCSKDIDVTSFECAHVISEKNGGEVTVDNLRATCKTCNASCGTDNLNEFKAKHFNRRHSVPGIPPSAKAPPPSIVYDRRNTHAMIPMPGLSMRIAKPGEHCLRHIE
jgi:5-methylcytosine-specific restriction endonuclease McrA